MEKYYASDSSTYFHVSGSVAPDGECAGQEWGRMPTQSMWGLSPAPAEIPPEPKTKLDCSLGTVMLRMLPFLPETLTGCYSLRNLLGLVANGAGQEQPLLRKKNGNTDAGETLTVLQSLQRGLDQSFNNQPEALSPTHAAFTSAHPCPVGLSLSRLWFQFESSPLTVSLTSFISSPLSS